MGAPQNLQGTVACRLPEGTTWSLLHFGQVLLRWRILAMMDTRKGFTATSLVTSPQSMAPNPGSQPDRRSRA